MHACLIAVSPIGDSARSGIQFGRWLRMKTLFSFLVLAVVLIACSSGPTQQQIEATLLPAPTAAVESKPKALPAHTVAKDTASSQGRRIEIHVTNSNLTKAECEALISAYRARAGSGGQVSVRKPDKSGTLQPWCVDNMDGTPVIFNDFYFK